MVSSTMKLLGLWVFSMLCASRFAESITPLAGLDLWKVVVQKAGVGAMHMTTQHTNKVIIFDRTDFGTSQIALPNGTCRDEPTETVVPHDCTAHSVQYDSITNSIRPLRVETDPFCSSGAFFSNGTLCQTGGWKGGANRVRYIGAGKADDWAEKNQTLSLSRWYSSNQILPDNRVIIVGGTLKHNFEFWPRPAGQGATKLAFLDQTAEGKSENNLYPFLHLCPDGNLFIFANRDSILLNYKSNKVVKTFPTFGVDPRNYPYSGSSVLLPLLASDGYTKAEVMICGGAPNGSYFSALNRTFLDALDTCGRMVITDANPTWNILTMPSPRVMCDMLILPTLELIIINGAEQGLSGWNQNRVPALAPFIYNIDDDTFTTQSPTTIPRMYHSTANVQADGTVLVAGSNDQAGYVFSGVRFPTELRIEKYSPYYLSSSFDLFRPIITYYPSYSNWSSPMVIKFTCPTPVLSISVSLYEPSFTTHANSMNQRALVLATTTVTNSAGTYRTQATSPPNGNVAPPGWYMLTVLNTGTNPAICSLAKWCHIGPL